MQIGFCLVIFLHTFYVENFRSAKVLWFMFWFYVLLTKIYIVFFFSALQKVDYTPHNNNHRYNKQSLIFSTEEMYIGFFII